MRSEFDDFNETGFREASGVFGSEPFTIGGVPGTYFGILNEFTCEKELDIGGKFGTYTATVICALDDFSDLDGPLERTLDGKRVSIAGRDFKVSRVAHDGVTLTLGLTNPVK